MTRTATEPFRPRWKLRYFVANDRELCQLNPLLKVFRIGKVSRVQMTNYWVSTISHFVLSKFAL